jgi:4a-hydroxytetrahydrobiopterin dehydratase
MPLKDERCVDITTEETAMEREEVESYLENLDDWELLESPGGFQLVRTYTLDDFEEAMEFAYEIADAAVEQAHTPTLTVRDGQAQVIWWTAQLEGLHRNDFIMAAQSDDIYERWGLISGDEDDEIDETLDETFPASDPPGTY